MNRCACLPLLLLLAWPLAAPALSTDRRQPIHLEADTADIDDRSGLSVYRGNVTLDQGSLHITANELRVHLKDGEIDRIYASGRPATFRQRPDGKDQDVEGEALRMEYHAAQDRLILLERAQVRQGGDSFASERIVYDIATDQVQAGAGGSDRVRIIIQPRGEKP